MANILIGVTGSVAAYKIISLVHELLKCRHIVKIILTYDAAKFVTPLAFASFGVEVYCDNNNIIASDVAARDSAITHINLARFADIILIAPLSANTLAKLAYGFADNLLSSTILAANKPIYLLPAMNMVMWQQSVTQYNVTLLKNRGFTFWGPVDGKQACGDIGFGRMLEINEILINIQHCLLVENKLFSNKKVVVTAGHTIEALDPVRYLSNFSSGKMGYALARAFAMHGAEVTLITANGNLTAPNNVANTIYANTANDILNASIHLAPNTDIYIGCAAISDYKVSDYSLHKIKKTTAQEMTLKLIKNPDIIQYIKLNYPQLFVVGFAAETQNVVSYAQQKLINKNLDLIIANDVSDNKVFAQDNSEVFIIDKNLAVTSISNMQKYEIAHHLVKMIANKLSR